MSSAGLRHALAVLAATLTLYFPSLHAQDEVRALWVVRTTLTSPSAMATMVDAAKGGGFNTLIVQVRGRGDAYFQGGIEPRSSALASQPAFDPLAVTIARALVDDLSRIDPRSPEYIGHLARDVRGRPTDLEGLYLSPIPAAAASYTVSVVRDMAERYEIDGVHFDYIQYPTQDFDYSRDTLAVFRSSVTGELSAAAFASEISTVRQAAGRPPVWAGIGAYRLSPDQIAENVRSARRVGVGGVILFSYDSLTDSTRAPGYLFQVGRAAFNQ
jgi:uncharacterized lipoprotein YddW (UPF0748 family)